MKAGTVALTAAIVAAFATVVWSRFSLQKRIRAVDSRMAAVTAEMEPIHSRCEVLEGLLAAVKEDLASVRDASTALSGTVASQAALISEGRGRVQQIDERLVEAREDANRRSSEIRAMLDEQVGETGAAGKRAAELAMQIERLEEQLEPLPAGTVLPWLPDQEGIPPGWLLCDGTRRTPDLRGLFLRGVGRFDEAGLYYEGAKMRSAGVHTHATDLNMSIYNLSRAIPSSPGDWLLLFDAGMGGSDPETLATHGSHVHQDEHVPLHFTVVFIMKESR